jgi:tetratricopeptide (TPR) repeat protein
MRSVFGDNVMNNEISTREKIFAFFYGTLSGLVVLVLLVMIVFQFPAVQDRFGWRIDFAEAYLRGVVDPVEPLPKPKSTMEEIAEASAQPTYTSTPRATEPPGATPTITSTTAPTLTPTAIPGRVELPAPAWEVQDLNNCGPATLAMYLRFYGWEGDQTTIASVVKPKKEDRNVNVEELVAYMNTEVPGLEVQYRVGGDVELLKRLLVAGFPVMIEETFMMEESYWPNDDRWAGHYLLVTGYDDASQTFVTQDSFAGSNILASYEKLNGNWKAFNRVYILVYPTESWPVIQSILGEQWDVEKNRQHALDMAQEEAEVDPGDSFAWFNQGTNLVFFEKYSLAAAAYDRAREAGLPQRMLRYQFGPFFAYFHVNRLEDLLELTEYALKRSPTSEEAMLWQGWAYYRKGEKERAKEWFSKALEARPDYTDAIYALNFVRDN